MTLNEADKVVHSVETQWHYAQMIAYGYKPETLTEVGFVRQYVYVHPTSGHKMMLCTGVSADYWKDGNIVGYWSDLETRLKFISTPEVSVL